MINHAAFEQQWTMKYNRIELDVTSGSERNANKSSQIATIDFARACVCLQSIQQMQKAHHYCQSIIIQTFKNLCMINCHYNTIRKKLWKTEGTYNVLYSDTDSLINAFNHADIYSNIWMAQTQ